MEEHVALTAVWFGPVEVQSGGIRSITISVEQGNAPPMPLSRSVYLWLQHAEELACICHVVPYDGCNMVQE
ncbi:hypothetical protein KUCAC02_026364 [Chaenocephalus aceratus]|uniref:Uncharacterized protein n=1 Tax=Chaenocephalus aceratus TaxID=36190 RepID=A0ACB9VX95_CHAAC|nr:hypothetical protein KUCAC02_026364 [Chaenocephalus aceratus]